MKSPARSVARLLISTSAGALVGIATWLILVAMRSYDGPASVVIVLPLFAGLAGGIGAELALRLDRPPAGSRARWLALLAGLCALYGGWTIVAARVGILKPVGTQALAMILPPTVVVALVAGLIAGRRGWPSAWLDGLGALALALANALLVALGAGLCFAVLYSNPCVGPMHGLSCLAGFGRRTPLQSFLMTGALLGLWLGVALWLALGASAALRPPSPARPRPGLVMSAGE